MFHKFVGPKKVDEISDTEKTNESTLPYTVSNNTVVKAQPPPPPKRGASISLTTTFRAPQIKSLIKCLTPSALIEDKEEQEFGTLEDSMERLAEGLENKTIISHFEVSFGGVFFIFIY